MEVSDIKITWEELENKINQEIDEFKQDIRGDNKVENERMIEYLEYLKGELKVELFILKTIQ